MCQQVKTNRRRPPVQVQRLLRRSLVLLAFRGGARAALSFVPPPTPSLELASRRRRGLNGALGTSPRVALSLSSSSEQQPSPSSSHVTRFLGKGERAVVRPGVVLIAPEHEYDHFLMKSAVFVHGVGTDELGKHVTRGVIIDHPTAFTMGEMGGGSITGGLAHNLLFRGGDKGNDSAMLLHSAGDQMDESDCAPVGTSGIFEGGASRAMDLVDGGVADPGLFKFFFNFVEFTDKELEDMLSATSSNGDAWSSVEVRPEFVLDEDYDRAEAWTRLRNSIGSLLRNDG